MFAHGTICRLLSHLPSHYTLFGATSRLIFCSNPFQTLLWHLCGPCNSFVYLGHYKKFRLDQIRARQFFSYCVDTLRTICKSVQFAKCAAQFWNHACAICKISDPNLTLPLTPTLMLTPAKSCSTFSKLHRLTNCAQQRHIGTQRRTGWKR